LQDTSKQGASKQDASKAEAKASASPSVQSVSPSASPSISQSSISQSEKVSLQDTSKQGASKAEAKASASPSVQSVSPSASPSISQPSASQGVSQSEKASLQDTSKQDASKAKAKANTKAPIESSKKASNEKGAQSGATQGGISGGATKDDNSQSSAPLRTAPKVSNENPFSGQFSTEEPKHKPKPKKPKDVYFKDDITSEGNARWFIRPKTPSDSLGSKETSEYYVQPIPTDATLEDNNSASAKKTVASNKASTTKNIQNVSGNVVTRTFYKLASKHMNADNDAESFARFSTVLVYVLTSLVAVWSVGALYYRFFKKD
jgi:hypothetical protein